MVSPYPYLSPWTFHYIFSLPSGWRGSDIVVLGGHPMSSWGQAIPPPMESSNAWGWRGLQGHLVPTPLSWQAHQSSIHLCGSPLDLLQWSMSFLSWGLQSWILVIQLVITSAKQRGRITHLSLLATLFLMQPRTPGFSSMVFSGWLLEGSTWMWCSRCVELSHGVGSAFCHDVVRRLRLQLPPGMGFFWGSWNNHPSTGKAFCPSGS